MGKQVYYEDVIIGVELPALEKHTPIIQMGRWAGASGDYDPLHYDRAFAQEMGFPDAIVQGKLKAAYMTQLVTDWMGPEGWLKKFSCQYRRVDLCRGKMILKGKVTKKYLQDDEHVVECELHSETIKGEKTTIGTAVVVLPGKKSAADRSCGQK